MNHAHRKWSLTKTFIYMVDCRINYSRISTFDLFALRWGSWLWCQEWMKTKFLGRHLSLIVLPIKSYNSMIYSNFSAKTLKTILTRLQIVCICFTGMDEKKTYTIWKIILNKIRDLAHEWPLTLPNKLQTLNFRGLWFLFWSGDGQVILTPVLTQLVPAVYFPPGKVGVLPSSRLMGMCRWMESHFHDWIDCYGVALFIRVTRMGSHIFNILGVRKFRCVGI